MTSTKVEIYQEIFVKSSVQRFMKIIPVRVELFNADRRTDGRTDGQTDRHDKTLLASLNFFAKTYKSEFKEGWSLLN